MKTKNIITILLCVVNSLCACFAQPVSKEKAAQTGISFFNERAVSKQQLFLLESKKETVHSITWKQQDKDCMFIVNMPDSGWVLVSGDERAEPILAFSDNGMFPTKEEMPPAMLELLQDYANEIMFIQDSCPNLTAHSAWQSINNESYSVQLRSNGNGSGVYTPGTHLLNRPNRGEVIWNQSWNYDGGCIRSYNKFCPDWYTASCDRTYVGCTAVAMGQIMWYWQWPHTGYIPVSISQSGKPSSTTELRLYNWNLMPDIISNSTPLEQVDMIAGFLRDCGYAAKMEYKSNGSSAGLKDARNALEETFSYADIDYNQKFWTFNWTKKIRDEINAGRPVLYAGYGDSGHAFIVDGYDAGNPDKFHVNWGWGGRHNDYFFLGDLTPGENHNYNSKQEALWGIQPSPSCGSTNVSENIASGATYRVGTAGTVTVSNSTVDNNAMSVYYSGTSVILKPGFHAKSGSHVHVAIQNFPCAGLAPRSLVSAERLFEETEVSEIKTTSLLQTFQIYPNPTQGNFYVEFSGDLFDNASLEISGINGQALYKTNLYENKQNISFFNTQGIYIVKIMNGNNTYTEKLVLE